MWKAVFTRKPFSVEQWAEQHSNKASADGLIAAAVVESFAKEWKDWVAIDLTTKNQPWEYPRYSPSLTNTKRGITVLFGVKKWLENETTQYKQTEYHVDWASYGTKVNGLVIERKAARRIIVEYERLAKVHKLADETAARIKAEMSADKAKWNLAENLLGMKRNEFGALVPVKTAEETCDDTPCADCASADLMCTSHQYTKKEKTNGTAKKRSGGTPRRILNGEQGLLSPLPN